MADVAGFVEDITYRIWNGAQRDPALCEVYYGPATVIHMDAGDVVGAAEVTANTRERLAAFRDFHGVIDDTIWTGDEDSGYRTSMRPRRHRDQPPSVRDARIVAGWTVYDGIAALTRAGGLP